jgi:hypothetical protein
MRAIGRDHEGGRLILERGDEKALGAVCHVAGVEASVYEAVVVAFRKATGRSMDDVRKAPVRFRLMRPAEIDRILGAGAVRADALARPVLEQVYDIIGMIRSRPM